MTPWPASRSTSAALLVPGGTSTATGAPLPPKG